jgi:hypothetical protein
VPDAEATGAVAALWRYPVKSMLGEELATAQVIERGIAGDRTRALVDAGTGQVASAKEPRRWKELLACAAAGAGDDVVLDLPGGVRVQGSDPDVTAGCRPARPVRRPVEHPPGAPEHQRAVPEEVLRHGTTCRSRPSRSRWGQARRPAPSRLRAAAPAHAG